MLTTFRRFSALKSSHCCEENEQISCCPTERFSVSIPVELSMTADKISYLFPFKSTDVTKENIKFSSAIFCMHHLQCLSLLLVMNGYS